MQVSSGNGATQSVVELISELEEGSPFTSKSTNMEQFPGEEQAKVVLVQFPIGGFTVGDRKSVV